MMIFDKFQNCIFCDDELIKNPLANGEYYICCRNKSCEINSNRLWAYARNRDINTIYILNVIFGNYQLCWEVVLPRTRLLLNNGNVELITFPYLLDFKLTKENVENKIKTLLTFM